MPELYSSKPATATTADSKLSENSKEERGTRIRDFLPPKKGHSLSSFMVLPSKSVRFETQEPEEEILMILRAHWITSLPWVFISVVLFFAPAVLRYFPLLSSFPARFQIIFVVVWYLVLGMFIFERFLMWFFNLSIITDERIIDIDFLDLIRKKVADADIDKIQDVSFNNADAFGAIFNYGNVLVQTAAEIVEFVFDRVPNPAKVADVLQRLRTEEKVEEIEGRVR